MNQENIFRKALPTAFYLEKQNIDSLSAFLRNRHFLEKNEELGGLSVPGEGNMNLVLRAQTNDRTFIIKQARPWVEKYPSIEAPPERIHVEANFLKEVKKDAVLQNIGPIILAFYPEHFLLITDDLGDTNDFQSLYAGARLSSVSIVELGNYLRRLHSLTVPDFPANTQMKSLNHQHIFVIPFSSENGLDLDEVLMGLSKVANECLYQDPQIIAEAARLGKQYLKKGPALIHGDFYPGSWLRTSSGALKIIDAEFAFKGAPEFDWAVFVAHALLSLQENVVIESILKESSNEKGLNYEIMAQFAGIEIIRRLTGVAQLPLKANLDQRCEMLNTAKAWIKNKAFF
jgi:5-methylthioribose kinase